MPAHLRLEDGARLASVQVRGDVLPDETAVQAWARAQKLRNIRRRDFPVQGGDGGVLAVLGWCERLRAVAGSRDEGWRQAGLRHGQDAQLVGVAQPAGLALVVAAAFGVEARRCKREPPLELPALSQGHHIAGGDRGCRCAKRCARSTALAVLAVTHTVCGLACGIERHRARPDARRQLAAAGQRLEHSKNPLQSEDVQAVKALAGARNCVAGERAREDFE